ncbi:MAG: hypothetical protein KDH20_20885 [Rhodocyclaceae bacterium]|nr:hypothetical protein [Rhodocyclaceae bacterium]
MRETILTAIASVVLVVSGQVRAEDRIGATVEGAPAAKHPDGLRAEIQRMIGTEGEGYLPASSAGRRRSISPEELLRLREDIRANRDIYETRERAGAGRPRR